VTANICRLNLSIEAHAVEQYDESSRVMLFSPQNVINILRLKTLQQPSKYYAVVLGVPRISGFAADNLFFRNWQMRSMAISI